MKTIPYLLIVIGLSITTSVSAQKETKAKELLDKTSAMLSKSGGMSASCSISMNDEMNNKQSFEGQFFLNGAKFFLDIPDQTVYFDGKTQWAYNKAYNEVSISEPAQQELQILNPILAFDIYKTDCDYKYIGEKTDIQKRKVHEISLFPKGKNEDIKQIVLQINPSDSMPVFFNIIFKNSMEFRIYIDKYQTKLTIPDSRFVFDKSKYPNVFVNDLR